MVCFRIMLTHVEVDGNAVSPIQLNAPTPTNPSSSAPTTKTPIVVIKKNLNVTFANHTDFPTSRRASTRSPLPIVVQSTDKNEAADLDCAGLMKNDLTSCRRQPSLLVECLVMVISLVNTVLAYVAYRHISYTTTGVFYSELSDHDFAYHDEPQHLGTSDRYHNTHIYKERPFVHWKNLVHTGIVPQ